MSEHISIPFNSDKHRRLLERILLRYRKSEAKMRDRYDAFSKAEELFTGYIKESDADRLRKVKWSEGVPEYQTFVVPYSYAQAMTVHTYMASVFLGRTPIFQFQGTSGAPEKKALAVEALIAYQVQKGGMTVPLYTWLLDPLKYGFGVIGEYWARDIAHVARIEERPVTIMGVPIAGKTRRVRVVERVTRYEGNRLYNVSPRNFFPDPGVPLSRFQDGEFCARTLELSWNDLKAGEANGQYFNVDIVRRMRASSRNRDLESGAANHDWPEPHLSSMTYPEDGFFWSDVLEMHINLIPKEWGLGSTEYPERWVFTVADERVIIGAQPLGLYHNEFPFSILEYEPEAYAFTNRGLLEVTEPLNKVMTWLVNSHMYNVRQVLNNQFVVDQTRINMRDLLEGGPGFIARVRPEAAGQDVRTMIQQLPVTDVTQNHLRDMQFMERLFQLVTGANDNVMGMVSPGGRKTATEVRQSSSFGVNRLKTIAEYFSALGWAPLAMRLLQNSQQLYSEEKQLRIVGDTAQGAVFIDVTPDSIAGEYDFVPVDGTLPVDRFAMANLWRQIFADMQRFPQVIEQFDMGGIFSYVAKLAGAKSIDQFRIQAAPDDSIAREAERGNLVPLRDIAADMLGAAGEPGQLPGMGRTG